MAKKKIEEAANERNYLIDKFIPFTEAVEGVEAPVVINGTTHEFGGIHILLNKRSMELYRRSLDGLIVSRRIPLSDDQVGVTDPLVVLLTTQDDTTEDPVYAVQQHYRSQRDQVNEHAYILAVTRTNKLMNEPRPYDDIESEFEDWEEGTFSLPPATRNLNNKYERRLKQIFDLVEDAGVMFNAKFERAIEEAVLELYKWARSQNTDEDGFRPSGVSSSVSDTDESSG